MGFPATHRKKETGRELLMARLIPGSTFLLPLVACIALCGCAGVVPLPARTQTPANQQLKEKVSANFIVPGQTTRSDVLAKLQPLAAGLEGDRFFMARWSSSNKGGWVFLCGYINCVGGGSRFWSTTNALVEFDDGERVAHFEVFGESALIARLSSLASREKPESFDPPREIDAETGAGYRTALPSTLVLSRDALEVRQTGKGALDFHISRRPITKITPVGPVPFPQIGATLHFAEKTKAGKSLSLTLDVPKLWIILEFLQQPLENVAVL